jgi:hypothetical protein
MIRFRPVNLGFVVSLGLALGCATTKDAHTGEAVESSASELTDLERRLQDADRVEIAFEIESTGAVASQFRGTLVWVHDGELRLDASGEFLGQPQQLELHADATTLEVRVAGEPRHQGPRPAALIEAMVLGLTRQGLLHNLAMATGGHPPERADGGIDEWIQVSGETNGPPLEFDIHVQGQRVGHATLSLDEAGRPTERRQTVEFPEGQMHVVERYTSFVVE